MVRPERIESSVVCRGSEAPQKLSTHSCVQVYGENAGLSFRPEKEVYISYKFVRWLRGFLFFRTQYNATIEVSA